MTTTAGEGQGGGPVIHIQIIFCNNYFNLNLPLDPYTRGRYNSQLQSALVTTYGLPAGRIQGLFVVQDPASGRLVMQFDIMPGPGMSSNDIELFISNRVTARTFSLTDMFNNVLSVNCYDLPVPPKKPNNNLLWLLTIPAAVASLSPPLLFLLLEPSVLLFCPRRWKSEGGGGYR